MDNKELIWVDGKFAEEYKKLDDDKTKRDEQIAMLNDYLDGVKATSRASFKSNLESLDEDVAIYKGLMISVKKAFEAAKNEQLQDSYALWEKFEKEIPDIEGKTAKIIETLDPLVTKLTEVNDLLMKIQIYEFDRLIDTVSKFANTYGESKEMVEFLINNYKPKPPEAAHE